MKKKTRGQRIRKTKTKNLKTAIIMAFLNNPRSFKDALLIHVGLKSNSLSLWNFHRLLESTDCRARVFGFQ